MADQPVDFWGLTRTERVAPHVQSFFVAFRPWVIGSATFRRFWTGLDPLSTRRQVIMQHEVGLSGGLHCAGFRSGSYFQETDSDRRLARRRVRWWAAHRPGLTRDARGPRHLPRPSRASRGTRRPRWPTAPSTAAGCRTSSSTPCASTRTGSGPTSCSTYCEEQLPDAFAGVREFIEDTAVFYPPRPTEKLRPTPPALVPLRRQVEYRRVP